MLKPSLIVLVLACVVGPLGLALPALAYVGPGVGLSMLGALWGILVAIVVAVGFIVAWPLRRLLKRRGERRRQSEQKEREPVEIHRTAKSS